MVKKRTKHTITRVGPRLGLGQAKRKEVVGMQKFQEREGEKIQNSEKLIKSYKRDLRELGMEPSEKVQNLEAEIAKKKRSVLEITNPQLKRRRVQEDAPIAARPRHELQRARQRAEANAAAKQRIVEQAVTQRVTAQRRVERRRQAARRAAKTSKGQPVMRFQVDHLLDRISKVAGT
eukprot:TRINITY_DN6529_c0_g1_i1.p1 TRINITY_DN6529_c0_g1~~TRINITY_DN6529_c0_g1_i1.p1  ORF type:complete len:177 (+),score=42.32 TRINITY_DN6529_c0_g1_i1:79-609(+)